MQLPSILIKKTQERKPGGDGGAAEGGGRGVKVSVRDGRHSHCGPMRISVLRWIHNNYGMV